MTARGLAALFLAVLAVGCGGSSVPEGTPISVRLEVVDPAYFGVPSIRVPQPLMMVHMNYGHAEWARVSRLLPDPLPEPVDQSSDCVSGYMVSVRLWTRAGYAGEVSYGPCRRPASIEPVRLLMHTLLRRRLAAERRCDCP